MPGLCPSERLSHIGREHGRTDRAAPRAAQNGVPQNGRTGIPLDGTGTDPEQPSPNRNLGGPNATGSGVRIGAGRHAGRNTGEPTGVAESQGR